MYPTISCKALERITTPQTLKIEGHMKKKRVQEVKDHIEKVEMNLSISCNALDGITTPKTINIEGYMKKKNVELVKDHIEHQEMNPTISCNALEEIITPQTIKIEGHNKKEKVIVLIDSGSTHNFIHCKIAKELNCFLYPAPQFQVMVASGGTINFSRTCHNIKLSLGEYLLNSPIFSTPMGGADALLRVQ